MRGYAYCRLIPVSTEHQQFQYLAQVFDYHTKDNNSSRNLIPDILKSGYLMHPVPIRLPQMQRGFGSWKFICELPLDNYVPEYKFTPEQLGSDESEISAWYSYCPISNKKQKKHKYQNIKHLEHFHIYTPEELAIRTTMEILKKENMKIPIFFDMEDPSQLNNYYRTINMPLYADIPFNIIGKASNTAKKTSP